jgi:hypothetical protein
VTAESPPTKYWLTEEQWTNLVYSILGISPYESKDPVDENEYPVPDGEEILKFIRDNQKMPEEISLPDSRDLLLIAQDEWKRREERKYLHDNISWVHGWISGFLTSREFVRDKLKELHKGENE